MGYGRPEEYLASYPIKLEFAGWRTDTLALQQNGWQVSADQHYYNRGIQFAFHHPEHRIRGLSAVIQPEVYMHHFRPSYGYSALDMPYSGLRFPAMLAADFVQHTASFSPMSSFADFKPIDAEPQYMRTTERMSDMTPFAPNLARTQELIIPEHSVDDLLNMLLEKQAPDREALIRRRVREHNMADNFSQRTHVHAQIVSIG